MSYLKKNLVLRDGLNLSQVMEGYMQSLESRIRMTPALKRDKVTNLFRETIDIVEKPLIEQVMKYTKYNQSRAAEILGINRNTVRMLMKKHGFWNDAHMKYWDWRRENGANR